MSVKKWIIIFSIVAILPFVLLLSSTALIYFNQNKILTKILNDVNEQTEGEITIADLKIAPFANFPYISIDLKDVKFYESKDKSCKPLYTFNDLYVGFDIKSVLMGVYDVKSVKIEGGHIDVVHFEDGSYNILKAKKSKSISKDSIDTEESIHLDLKRITIKNVDVSYLDRAAKRDVNVRITDLNAKIKYVNEHIFINLVTDMKLDVLQNNKPTFFVNKNLLVDMEWDFEEKSHILNIMPSNVTLNQAQFIVNGKIDVDNELDMAINVKGNKPDFGIFGAFLPDDISENLAKYKNEGKIFFEGTIVGKASNGHIPLVNINFGCEEAYFLNKTVNKKIDRLRFTGSFTNGAQRTLASSIFQLNNIYARPEQGVFQGHLLIKNFIDPIVKIDIHADLDLQFLSQFFQLKSFEHVKGKILLDMDFDEIVDLNFPGASLASLKMGIDSELTITDLSFIVPELNLLVENMNGHAAMQKGKVELDSISWQIGDNDFWISGNLSDLPALFHRYDKDIRIELLSKSKKIDISKLLAFDTTLANKYQEKIENFTAKLAFETKASELFDFKYLPKGEFFIEDFYAKLAHYPHIFHDFQADIIITEKDLSLIDFSGEIDSTDFHFTGKLINYTKWFQPEPLGDSNLEFDLTSKLLKLENLLSYNGKNYLPEDYRNEILKDTKLHGRLDMHYDKGFQSLDLYLDEFTSKMKIHPLKLEKFKGRLHYEDEHIIIEKLSGRMGKSDFSVNMSYFLGEQKDEQKGQQKRTNYLNLKSFVFDLDALTNYTMTNTTKNHGEAFNLFTVPFPNIDVTVDIGKLNYHRYWLENFHTKVRLKENHYIYVDSLNMNLVDGNMQMQGYFNGSDSNNIYYYSDIIAQNLDIDKLMIKFDNFGQDQLINENIHGKISGKIKSTFKMHPDLTPIAEKSEAHMELTITDGSIVNFTPMQAMSKYFKDKNLNKIRFDTLRNVLDLKDGALSIPKMNINSSLGFIELSGKQKFDLTMEYFVRVPLKMVTKVAWSGLFGKKSQSEVDLDQIDEIQIRDDNRKVRFLNLKITGSVDDYKVSLGSDKKK